MDILCTMYKLQLRHTAYTIGMMACVRSKASTNISENVQLSSWMIKMCITNANNDLIAGI